MLCFGFKPEHTEWYFKTKDGRHLRIHCAKATPRPKGVARPKISAPANGA